MRLAKVLLDEEARHVALLKDSGIYLLDLSQTDRYRSLADILKADDPFGLVKYLLPPGSEPVAAERVRYLAPVDRQEVWAAGVTYKRSQVARMEESKDGANHYDKVYTADRPELFLKSLPDRVVHPGQPVRVRNDSDWSVPEPELALMISSDLELVGFTIGNDMSARDIEGENPLYLPQAKVYNQSCTLGPAVLVPEQPLNREATLIKLTIRRGGKEVFKGETNAGQIARSFEDLISWLGKQYDFPNGAILLTGTGVVPPDDFTLRNGDEVSIEITGIGVLTNPVVQG